LHGSVVTYDSTSAAEFILNPPQP